MDLHSEPMKRYVITKNYNVDIKECEFYNPRYIKIYSEIDDELIDFIENNTMPDYQYDGRYSPVNLYNDILRRERNEESYN